MVAYDFTKVPVIKVVDDVIVQAAKMSASDIHFDPRENDMLVRFRVDGDLKIIRGFLKCMSET